MTRQIKRYFCAELRCVSRKAFVLILLIYSGTVLLQFNTSGAWLVGLREGRFIGFFPDPTMWLSAEDVLLFGDEEAFRSILFNVAPLAHAMLYPFFASFIVPFFVSSGFCGEKWKLTEARGGSRESVVIARSMLSTIFLVGAFVISSVVLYRLIYTTVPGAQSYCNLGVFSQRLILASAVCLAYTVSCVIVVSYFGSGFGSIGVLLIVNIVLIYLQLGTDPVIPVPSSMLMWICGVGPIGSGQVASILLDCLINVFAVLGVSFVADWLRSKISDCL